MSRWSREESVNFLVPEFREKARLGPVRVCFHCLAREAVARVPGGPAQFCREPRCEAVRLEMAARAVSRRAASSEATRVRGPSASPAKRSAVTFKWRRRRCEVIDLSRVEWPRPAPSSPSSSPPASSARG